MAQKFLFSVFLILGIFCFKTNLVQAEVIINEVAWMGTENSQYEEWLELYNTGEEAVSLAGWKLYKKEETLLFSLSKTIPAGGYLLVCRTTASVPDPLEGICEEKGVFGGSGLNNTSDFLELQNTNGSRIDSIDALSGWPAGEATEKKTMQWSGESWVSASPTPGEENETVSLEEAEGETEGNSNSEVKKAPPEPKVRAKIEVPKVVFAEEPFSFRGVILENLKEVKYRGRYYWNLGDGKSLETFEYPGKLEHTYFYPGEYAVFFDYFPDVFTDIPKFAERVRIEAIPLEVSIEKVGGIKDFGIEILNKATEELDISGWSLVSGRKAFIFPQRSILLPKKSLTISGRRTGFTFGDEKGLKLFSKTGEIRAEY